MVPVRVLNDSSYPIELVAYKLGIVPANSPPTAKRHFTVTASPRLELAPGEDFALAQFDSLRQSILLAEILCKGEDGNIRTCGAEIPMSNSSLTFVVDTSTIRVVVGGGPE
jgi:hypothetical protein